MELNYICEYKPEKYSGIKLTFKYNLKQSLNIGFCLCNNQCTCTNVTILIFQTGKILAVGFKSRESIDIIYNEFNKLMELLKYNIKKKLMF